MASKAQDLSGQWDGSFSYPSGRGPRTAFRALITQSGTGFTGLIEEPSLYRRSEVMEAEIVGVLAGRSVDFTKTYIGAGFGYENPVDYVGQLSADADTITGVWSLMDMNGRFEMRRRLQAAAEETREETAKVDR